MELERMSLAEMLDAMERGELHKESVLIEMESRPHVVIRLGELGELRELHPLVDIRAYCSVPKEMLINQPERVVEIGRKKLEAQVEKKRAEAMKYQR